MDHTRLTIYLARQAFVELRSLARDRLPGRVGANAAADSAYQIVAIAFFVRYIRHGGGDLAHLRRPLVAESVLVAAHEFSSPSGRQWLDSLALDLGGTVRSRSDVPANLVAPGLLRSAWDKSGEVLAAGSLPRVIDARPGTALLCDYLALKGLSDIHGLIGTAGVPDEMWRQINMIADTCHRVPVSWDPPAALANLVLRRPLRDAWRRASAAGQEWIKESVASATPRFERHLYRIIN